MDLPGIALRFALFVDLLLLVGIAGYAGWRHPVARLPWIVAMLAIVGMLLSAAGLVVLAAGMAGTAIGDVDRTTLEMVVTATAVGRSWVVRIVALCVAVALAARPRLAALAGAVALATLAWGGHGAMDEGVIGRVHLVADIVHLFAAALWIGVLALLCALLVRLPDPSRIARTHRLASGFAGLGTVLVVAIVASGIVNAWLLVGGFGGLTGTLYGRLLLVKLMLFAAMLCLAALNRFRLTPALALPTGDPASAWRGLRASVAVETGCGIAILALVAWLGTLAPPVAGL
ncbi:hypothetical protein ASG37_01880 [Sphingomonas sp. Leaf407]|uniref:copper homeostasis membrane protein CopD n=1 Tax=unclassified Sphingomonas TaxID=196159 RepID=UPI0006F2ED67|nr:MULTISPECIES: copper homeostasis membrane protein CopD [unclassified Sphingomonas]KQN40564.1 hypothetical protein ASE97_01905 [Sphingomonas sp. Leaf42]KQT29919.1 hypothetical protein ASG37_01880 [Sphingomonas sp. Leaf407]